MRNTLKKEERICSQKEIDYLFANGDSFACYPLRIIYTQNPEHSGADISMMVSVPKKRFKRAVHRNRIKRLIKEAYRLNKTTWIESLDKPNLHLQIVFLFVGKEICPYQLVESTLIKALSQLRGRLSTPAAVQVDNQP